MTMTPESILVTFQSLVDVSKNYNENDYDDGNDNDHYSIGSCDENEPVSTTVEEHQGNLCDLLLSQLHEIGRERQSERRQREECHLKTKNECEEVSLRNDKNEAVRSIRCLFPNSKVSDLIPAVLNPLLNDRVDTQELLPGTQDDTANEEVLSESTKAAFSLTLPGMQAGLLYAHLLSLPGALGSGMVDLEPLTALVALIRRWTMECCGRERSICTPSSRSVSTNRASWLDSSTNSPPQKRSRKDKNKKESINKENIREVQTRSVLAMGSLVAAKVCEIPQQTEFSSWSSESQEVLLEAVLIAMGTAAALLPGKRTISNDCNMSNSLGHTEFEGNHDSNSINSDSPEQNILHHGQKALESCLVGIDQDEEYQESNSHHKQQQQQHETSIIILRGLMHLLQLKVIVPNGERGKLEAYTIASEVLISLMKKKNLALAATKVTTDVVISTKTPSRCKTRRASIGTVLNSCNRKDSQTPKSTITRRRRASLDGGLTPFTSPALKKKRNQLGNIAGKKNEDVKPRGIPAIFLGLLQKLTTGRVGLEKALLRKNTVQTVQSCMEWLPHTERTHFLEYILKICHSKVSVHRLVACELLGAILSQTWLEQHDDDLTKQNEYEEKSGLDTPIDDKENPEKNYSRLPQVLWSALQGRLMDKIAAVRASAANSLEAVMIGIQKGSNKNWYDLRFFQNDDGKCLLMALRKRAIKDETATVRKASILALTKVLLVRKDSISEYYIKAICELCQDSSLLTRRAASEALTVLLEDCTSNKEQVDDFAVGEQQYDVGLIVEAWSSCVLPMILDEETAVKARSAFLQVVVLPIVENNHLDGGQKQEVSWRILAHVGNQAGHHGASKSAVLALRTALNHLGRENSDLIHVDLLRRAAILSSQTLCNCDISDVTVVGVWCLLEALLNETIKTHPSATIDLSFCTSAWEIMLDRYSTMPKSLGLKSTLRSSLVVLSKVASRISSNSQECEIKLHQKLLSYNFPPDSIGPALSAMTELSGSRSSEKWIQSIFSESEKEISVYVQDEARVSSFFGQTQPKILRALFSVGEVSMIGFKLDDDEKTSPLPLYLKPSKQLRELIQILVSGHLPGGSQTEIPQSVRAHAFTVLGKFCLRDESLARESLIILAQELHPSTSNQSQSVQSNALLVMGDLCVRYTNMTDR